LIEFDLLVVDDEEEILKMLRRNLEIEGYRLTTTMDPREAVELMKERLFNLVMTDIKMPGMSGVKLLRAIKEINPLANVLIMTGYSSMTNVVDCLGAGAVDYFVKPFSDLEMIVSSLNDARDRVLRWKSSMGLLQ